MSLSFSIVWNVSEKPRYSTVNEALLYERLPDDKVRCGLCERRCQIPPGQKGFCKTRVNVDGKALALAYRSKKFIYRASGIVFESTQDSELLMRVGEERQSYLAYRSGNDIGLTQHIIGS